MGPWKDFSVIISTKISTLWFSNPPPPPPKKKKKKNSILDIYTANSPKIDTSTKMVTSIS